MEKHTNNNRRAFLVRLWRDGPLEPWRASAKEVTNGREFFFVSLEKLFLFLYAQTNEVSNEQLAVGSEQLAVMLSTMGSEP